MEDIFNKQFSESRRNFLKKSSLGFGSIALSSLLSPSLGMGKNFSNKNIFSPNGMPHFIPKAKRVIYLFQSGGPSQIETYDYKPILEKWHGKEIPPSLKKNTTKFRNGRGSILISVSKIYI